jgi:hypothetical protein
MLQTISELIIGIIIGGFISGISLFLFNWLYHDIYKKPKLEVEKPFSQESIAAGEKWRQIGFIIKNDGRSEAKNCMGSITIHNFESNEDIFDTRIWEPVTEPTIKGNDQSLKFRKENDKWLERHGILTAKDRKIDLKKVGVFLDRRLPGIDFIEKEVIWDYPNTPVKMDINKNSRQRIFVARLRHAPDTRAQVPFDMIDIPSGYGWDKNFHVILRPNKNYECTLYLTCANFNLISVKFVLDGEKGQIRNWFIEK